jgi:hypothetical protein
MQAIAINPLYIGLAVAVLGLVMFVGVLAALAFFLFRKPAATSPVTGDVTALTHTAANWGLLTGVWDAVRQNNKPLLQFELAFLTKLANQLGGPSALFEKILLDYLEKQIAAGQATPIATKIASLFSVDVRTLLDGLEGKTPATDPAPTKSVLAVATPITGLIVLCVTLFVLTASAQAAPPLRSPERFYPAEVQATIDPPTFRTAQVTCPSGTCLMPTSMVISTPRSVPQQPIYQTAPQGGQVRRGIFPDLRPPLPLTIPATFPRFPDPAH